MWLLGSGVVAINSGHPAETKIPKKHGKEQGIPGKYEKTEKTEKTGKTGEKRRGEPDPTEFPFLSLVAHRDNFVSVRDKTSRREGTRDTEEGGAREPCQL